MYGRFCLIRLLNQILFILNKLDVPFSWKITNNQMENILIWISNYCYTKPTNWFAAQKMCFTRLILKGDFNANIKVSVWKKYLINHMKNGDLSDHVVNTRSKNLANKTSRVIIFGLILSVWRLQRDHILERWLQCLYVSPKVVWKTPIHCIRGFTGWPLLHDFNSRNQQGKLLFNHGQSTAETGFGLFFACRFMVLWPN